MKQFYSLFIAFVCFIIFTFCILYFEKVTAKFLQIPLVKKILLIQDSRKPPKIINLLILVIEMGIVFGVIILIYSLMKKIGGLMGIHL
jgi:hypothetical protein